LERFDSKQVAKNLSISVIQFVLQIGVGFVLTPILINTFGVSSFGIIRLATSTTLYVGLISKSFSAAVDRFFIIELQKGNTNEANTVLNTALLINLCFFLFSLPILILISLNAEKIFSIPQQDISGAHFLFLVVQLNFFLNIFTSPFYSPATANNRVDIISFIDISNKALNLFLSIVVSLFFSSSIGNLGYVQLILGIVNVILIVSTGYRFAPFLKLHFKFFSKEKAKGLLKMSFWLLLEVIGTIIFLNSDVIFANLLFGAVIAGQFSALLPVVSMLRGIGNIVNRNIIPLIYKLYSEAQYKKLEIVLQISTKISSLIMGIISGLVFIYSEDLLYLWLGANFNGLGLLMFFLLLPWTFTLAMGPVHTMRRAYNRIKIPTIILIAASFLNVSLIFILGKGYHFGYFLIPISAAIFNNSRHIIEIVYLKKIKVLSSYRLIISVFSGILSMTLAYFIGRLVKNFIIPDVWWAFFLSGGVAFIITIVISWIIFLRKDERHFLITKIKKAK
jgi:O-antigen/teichoic acid export membrane protein